MGEQGASDLTWGYDIMSQIPFALAYVSPRRISETYKLIVLQGLPRNLASTVRLKTLSPDSYSHTSTDLQSLAFLKRQQKILRS